MQAGADATVVNGGQRTASELVRVEISELEAYEDELSVEIKQEVRWFVRSLRRCRNESEPKFRVLVCHQCSGQPFVL